MSASVWCRSSASPVCRRIMQPHLSSISLPILRARSSRISCIFFAVSHKAFFFAASEPLLHIHLLPRPDTAYRHKTISVASSSGPSEPSPCSSTICAAPKYPLCRSISAAAFSCPRPLCLQRSCSSAAARSSSCDDQMPPQKQDFPEFFHIPATPLGNAPGYDPAYRLPPTIPFIASSDGASPGSLPTAPTVSLSPSYPRTVMLSVRHPYHIRCSIKLHDTPHECPYRAIVGDNYHILLFRLREPLCRRLHPVGSLCKRFTTGHRASTSPSLFARSFWGTCRVSENVSPSHSPMSSSVTSGILTVVQSSPPTICAVRRERSNGLQYILFRPAKYSVSRRACRTPSSDNGGSRCLCLYIGFLYRRAAVFHAEGEQYVFSFLTPCPLCSAPDLFFPLPLFKISRRAHGSHIF